MSSYSVTVGKTDLTFAAAHFITFEDGRCEPIHGHNYRVAVRVDGPLNRAGYVCDFVTLRAVVQTTRSSPLIARGIRRVAGSVAVGFERGYEPSEMSSNPNHRYFTVREPGGHEITFNSTHTTGLPV